MEAQRIRLFIKPWCGWCHEAKDWLDARGISYELLDVTRDSQARAEMKELSGQTLTPTLEVDGEILADFGVEELELFFEEVWLLNLEKRLNPRNTRNIRKYQNVGITRHSPTK